MKTLITKLKEEGRATTLKESNQVREKLKTNMKNTILIITIALTLPLSNAQAVMQSLNGLSGQSQTFTNDTNIGVNSSGTAHAFTWSGLLPISRGGTGADSYATGSIPFFWNGIFSQTPLFSWDYFEDSPGEVQGGILTIGGTGTTTIYGDNSNDAIFGVGIQLKNSGNLFLGQGGSGGVIFQNETITEDWAVLHSFASDTLSISGGLSAKQARFDVSGISDSTARTFTFPDFSGTFSLLERNQTFTGLNKFEATSTNSTIYIGSSSKSGCIALGDSDNSGITWVTANDGVLSATSTKPANCQ